MFSLPGRHEGEKTLKLNINTQVSKTADFVRDETTEQSGEKIKDGNPCISKHAIQSGIVINLGNGPEPENRWGVMHFKDNAICNSCAVIVQIRDDSSIQQLS